MTLPPLDRRTFLRRSAYAGLIVGAGPLATQSFGAAPATTVLADGAVFAKVRPRTLKQAQALMAFDDTHKAFADGSMELLLWPGDRTRLDRIGVDYQVIASQPTGPAPGRTSGLPLQPGERATGYRRLGDYYADMQMLATKYPKRARMVKLAEPSLEGRDMFAIEIADDPVKAATDGRPTFFVDGVHHAREWPSSEYSIMFAFDLLESYGTQDRITKLLKKIRVVVVPVVNPDGFNHSREGLTAPVANAATETALGVPGLDAYWRKNKRSFTGALYAAGEVNGYLNADAHGTDPNRNYPFYWGGEGGGADPTSQTYGGAAPYAEPEARNISGYMKAHQTTAYLTNHTSGQLCMRPWGYTSDDSPDGEFQEALGEKMCDHHGYKNQIGLSLYPTAGTSRDWSYGALRTIVYTFEHNQEFHPDYASEIPKTYALNRPAWLILAEAAADPRNHGVITGRVNGAPKGATVTLTRSFKTPTAVEVDAGTDGGVAESIKTVTTVRSDGTFTVHANPSTRPTTIQDGRGKEFWTVTVTAPGRKKVVKKVFLDRGTKVDLGRLSI
ncbi:MAG: M14 family zinc carboxypeptidase [Mycobacteriales bacterium]|nr:M14 family zinc carboxypeptidase [Mycobacteriales bacterium]